MLSSFSKIKKFIKVHLAKFVWMDYWRASEMSETLSGLYNGKMGIMVRAISVYSMGVPYAARFTAAVKIPLPVAMFQF